MECEGKQYINISVQSVGNVKKKNWALSVDLCQLQMLPFLVHLTDLLSTLLRCNGFARIQNAVVNQNDSRPPNVTITLFLMQDWLWEVLWSFSLVQPRSWLLLVVV